MTHIKVDAYRVTFWVNYDVEGQDVLECFVDGSPQEIWDHLNAATQDEIERQIRLTAQFEASAMDAADEDRADLMREMDKWQ